MSQNSRKHTRNTENDLFAEDPEVERTLRRNLREQRNRTTPREDSMAEQDRAVEPPPQQQQQQPQRIRLKDRAKPNVLGFRSSIAEPEVTRQNFELKPGLIQMIQQGQFGGSMNENPNAHITRFLQLCNTMKINEVSDEAIRLRLFPFSLRDRASDWLLSMPPNTFTNWEGLSEAFLAKFFPPAKTARIRNEINNFGQRDSESLYEAWERMKELQRQCPHHGIPDWLVVQTFYNGLEPSVRGLIDSAAGGSLMTKTEEEALELIEEMALHNFQYGNARGNVKRGSINELEAINQLGAQVEQLTKKIAQINTSSAASISSPNCEFCGDGHSSAQCVYNLQELGGEQINVVGPSTYNQNQMPVGNPYSNTYNPGWRNHPNFSWSNT